MFDAPPLLFLFCIVLPLLATALLVVGIVWLVRRSRRADRVIRPVEGITRQSAAPPQHDGATLALLQQIRAAPDPRAALDAAIRQLQTTQESVPHQGQAQPDPSTGIEDARVLPSPGPGPAQQGPRRGLPQVDNITLLLYLGAALVVIGAGVFIGGSWDAISGLARTLVVLLFALGFLVTGELFVRATSRLAQAGVTFRNLGALLLPFVPLAYDNFVLDGQAGPLFWSVTGLGAALFYGAWFRVSQPGRMGIYLAVWGVGVFAATLPALLGLDPRWGATTLQVLAALLIGLAYLRQPDGQRTVRRIFRADNDLLAESWLISGGVMALLGIARLAALDGAPHGAPDNSVLAALTANAPLLLLGANVAAVGIWLGTAVPVAVGTIPVGVGLFALAGHFFSDNPAAPHLPLLALGVLTWTAANLWGKRLHWGYPLLAVTGIGWVLVVRLTGAFVDSPPWLGMTATILYTGLILGSIVRVRGGAAFWPGWIVLHLGLLDLLAQFPSRAPSLLLPALIWFVLAWLWLGLERSRLAPVGDRNLRVAFAADALLCTLTTIVAAWLVRIDVVPDLRPPSWESNTVAMAGLTAGWLLVAVVRPGGRSVAGLFLQSMALLFALVHLLWWPAAAFGLLVMALAVAAWGAGHLLPERLLPAAWRAPLRTCGLVAAPVAVLLSQLPGAWLGLTEGTLPMGGIGQALLAVAVLLHTMAARRAARWAVSALLLSILLAYWLILAHVPPELAPPVLLAAALLLLGVGRLLRGRSAWLYAQAGYLVALVAPEATLAVDPWSDVAPVGLPLDPAQIARLTLLAVALLYVAGGLHRKAPWRTVAGGLLAYLFYVTQVADFQPNLQFITAPFALLALLFGWYQPALRRVWQVVAVLALLLPSLAQMVSDDVVRYSLVTGGWGLLLLALGMVRGRRVLTVGGAAGLLAPALYQLVLVAATLPPAVTIVGAGLLLMVAAVLIILNRERLGRLFGSSQDAAKPPPADESPPDDR